MSAAVDPNLAVHLAACLHGIGYCGDAAHHGAQAWNTWRRTHGPRHPRGILIAVPYIAILAGCDRTLEAHQVLAQLGPTLPPRDSTARHAVADWASALIAKTITDHQPLCARALDAVYQLDIPPNTGNRPPLPSTADWSDFFLQ